MGQMYWGLYSTTVLDKFRDVMPCFCHSDKPYNPPLYNVRTSTGTTYLGSRGPIIKEVTIECLSCGQSRTSNVEYKEIYENDFIA